MQRRIFMLDERTKKKLEETSMVVLLLFYIVCPVEMLIKIITTHDFLSVLGEIIILLSITATFSAVNRFGKNYEPTLPRKNNGEQLSAEQTKVAKHDRMLIYAKESLITAIGFIIALEVIDYLLQKQNITWSLNFLINQLVTIIIASIIFFTINFIYKERRISNFNKSNGKLDK